MPELSLCFGWCCSQWRWSAVGARTEKWRRGNGLEKEAQGADLYYKPWEC
jgi:hypothetical protein